MQTVERQEFGDHNEKDFRKLYDYYPIIVIFKDLLVNI